MIPRAAGNIQRSDSSERRGLRAPEGVVLAHVFRAGSRALFALVEVIPRTLEGRQRSRRTVGPEP
jgi:hypothetical protein